MKNLPFRRRVRFALSGISVAFRGEASFRTQCLAACLVVAVLLLTRPAAIWWAVLLLACACVLAAELLNTALEHALDALHPGEHPAMRAAKDCAAGAVLVLSAACIALFVAFLAAM